MFRFISPPLPHLIYCGEDTYPASGRHSDRSGIGVFDLLIVTRGCLYMAEESVSLEIPAGSFALLRPDRAHRSAAPCREETHFYWVHFQTLGSWHETDQAPASAELRPDDVLYEIHRFAFYLPRSGKLSSPDAAYDWLRQLLALQADAGSSSQWRRQLVFQELLMRLQADATLPERDSYLTIAEEAAAFLRRHYRDAINYKSMSETLHFHANYVSLCMKRAFGCTPLQYLTRYRVELAKRLLIDTNEPVGRIAEETGFGTFSYFVRCFGRQVGTTPRSFRMRYRQG
ncbi:helix-turn-helix domain-containing protein [Cohnella rhizosphaerae]|uniref:AraC family transcriptional regulator n=1 Tax=Cohnella rhizosphaerae TaxID=1457232 RepID=A0A9X4L2P6_9BACL|nr:AraC family transcriptional regulator [Cohnella rhizosphaerae]MDG0812362.1 AraC family transcriptional regulator [Cohnella rhizosphaerae]